MSTLPPVQFLNPKSKQIETVYLSDSQVKTFQKDPAAWFDDKILRLPRKAQMQVMAVGSAFDSFTKHKLSSDLFGPQHQMTIDMAGQFESSVESHNRDQARIDGNDCLRAYIECGRYAQLLKQLSVAESVHFESDLRRPWPKDQPKITKQDDCYTVPVDVYKVDPELSKAACKMQVVPGSGVRKCVRVIVKPDLIARFLTPNGIRPTIVDWKVNGFYSKQGAKIQPMSFTNDDGLPFKCKRGYLYGPDGTVNPDHSMQWPIPEEWSNQLHLYAHISLVHLGLLHEETTLAEGAPFDTHVSIDQLAWLPGPGKYGDPYHHMEVYQYHSENNTNQFTKLHQAFSMVCTALENEWWDPFCGDQQVIFERAQGRLNASVNTGLAALCRTR